MYYISDNKRSITNGHESIQIGKGLAAPTKSELKLAEKIVKAMNNTYAIDVDPDNVPLMKSAIELTVKRFDMYWGQLKTNTKLLTDNFKTAFLKPLKESL